MGTPSTPAAVPVVLMMGFAANQPRRAASAIWTLQLQLLEQTPTARPPLHWIVLQSVVKFNLNCFTCYFFRFSLHLTARPAPVVGCRMETVGEHFPSVASCRSGAANLQEAYGLHARQQQRIHSGAGPRLRTLLQRDPTMQMFGSWRSVGGIFGLP